MIAGSEFALLQTIEDVVPVGITAIDKEGRQTYVNAAFCRMVGNQAGSALASWPAGLAGPADRHHMKVRAG